MGATQARAALPIAALSGFAGLGYEIIWTQQLGIGLGVELVAVLAVLAAFFGGLALGARGSARAIERSPRPALWYAACEALIAAWALLLSVLMPAACARLLQWIGPQPSALWHWTVAFLGPFLLLLPATCAMGATLPALERTGASSNREGRAIGALYAAQTFGAVLGVLGSALLLVPSYGLAGSARICAALNATSALLALLLWRDRVALEPAPLAPQPATQTAQRSLPVVLWATGLLGIGYEVLVVRVLGQVTEDTVFTFAILLALYLLGSAAGAAIYQRWLAAHALRSQQRERLLAAVALACASGVVALAYAKTLKDAIDALLLPVLNAAGAALAAETAIAAAAFLLPALAMGMLFSQLCVEAQRTGLGLGSALAWNTFGAALAPLAFAVLLLPALGPKSALLIVALGYLALNVLGAQRARGLAWHLVAVFVGAWLLVGIAPPLTLINVPEGGRVVRYEEGVSAAVSVVEDADGTRTLHIDNHEQEGSSATLLADARQAWLPLLLHPHPSRALFLGLGTGLTSGAAGWDPALRVDAVELLPEVVRAAASFTPVLGDARPAHVLVADARRYVRSAGPRYDVIVGDLFHPARSGAAALFTVEHFAAVRARLAESGLYCQWLPLHQLDLASVRSITSAFLRVYPQATALLATNGLDTPVLGLLARNGGKPLRAEQLRARLAGTAAGARLAALHLDDELAILGSFVAGPRALQRFAAGAEPNSDDRPLIAQRAALLAYAPSSSPRARLIALLHALSVQPADVLPNDSDSDSERERGARLAAYWRARDRFIELGAGVRPSPDPERMLAQVRAPLLAILRASPDFRPAYDPLLNMAAALAANALPEARALLGELALAQPARPEAPALLQRLAFGRAVSATP